MVVPVIKLLVEFALHFKNLQTRLFLILLLHLANHLW